MIKRFCNLLKRFWNWIFSKPIHEPTPDFEHRPEEKNDVIIKYTNTLLERFDNNILFIKNIDTALIIKDKLISYENKQKALYKKYMTFLKDETNRELIKKSLQKTFFTLDNETDGEKYNEAMVEEAQTLSYLYQKNDYDRTIIDLYNDLTDYIDNRRRTAITASDTLGIMTIDTIKNAVVALEDLQENINIYSDLYDISYFDNIEIYEMPKKHANFLRCKDKKNNLDFVKIMKTGKWQVNSNVDDW